MAEMMLPARTPSPFRPVSGRGGTLAQERAADAVSARVAGRAGRPERHDRTPHLAETTLAALARGASSAIDSVGQPLHAGIRTVLEQSLGADLGAVRVHATGAAGRFAASLGANAATMGQQILGSAERLNSATAEGLRLISHEAAHTVQQGMHAAPAIQFDAIDDVRDKLSYGIVDWAVTDSDAMAALALLEALPGPALAAGLGRLEQKYLDRLIDNLPDAAKSGAGYQRIIAAIGAARALPQAEDLLSYGVLDWAVTDADVTKVFNTMVNLPAPDQERFLAGLDTAGKLGRLVSNSAAAHQSLYIRPWISSLTRGRLTPAQQRILRVIVTQSGDGALATLVLAAGVRFDVPVGRGTIGTHPPSNWSVAALRETYLALDSLPDSHVARNAAFRRLGAFSEGANARGETTLGVYSGGKRELDINVTQGELSPTVLHETGHSVDKQMGWTAGLLPSDPKRGGWVQYGANTGICAHDMVDDSNAGILGLNVPQRDDVETDMAAAMTNRTAVGLAALITARPWYAGLAVPVRASLQADPALRAIRTGLDHPWFKPNGGDRIGAPVAHVYEESYSLQWNRYDFPARTRLLTDYQFRTPGEWFAEVYAFYFGGPDKRRTLTATDPDTAAYFRTSVAPLAPSR